MRQDQIKKNESLEEKSVRFSLDNYLNREYLSRKITCIPLEFQYVPVEILSKQFTKLNNPHPYRIHYLGPRFKNTLELHKKNAFTDKKRFVYNSTLFGDQTIFQKNNKKQQIDHSEKDIIQLKSLISLEYQQKVTAQEEDLPLQEQVSQTIPQNQGFVQKYKIDMRKIAHSFHLQEKLKNTQYFKSTVYYRAFEGMNPSLNLDKQFVFNSCFQNGNLDCVIKLSERQFDLFLRIDSNTRGHLLWFYFSVKNNSQIGKIKMNISNFSKSKNLYKEGLRPYIFSTQKHKKQGKGWQQNGTNLGLQKSDLKYQVLQNKFNSNNINCLTLEYDFQFQNDEVFFSYCIPYTYSQLLYDIDKLPQKYVQKQILGKSLLGTNIPILHITDNHTQNYLGQRKKSQYDSTTSNINSDLEAKNIKNIRTANKKVIFVTGRIHPSESNSSYVVMGFISWLCSDQKQAVQLRKIARFIIVPMVNPDGVIIGNSRASASGKDLNRQYINPDPSLHPQIFMIKELARKIHQQNPITLFLDFHGHSRKKNTFFYGPVYSISEPNYYKCRILPKLIQKISNPFRYHSCSFNIIEDKKKTARASMFQNLGIQYTYTVESSIGYFYDCEKLKVFEFSQQQWRKMGSSIAQGTSMFIVGIDTYEQILSQKRKLRLKKKKFYRYPQTKVEYLEDEMFPENDNGEQSLRIIYQDKDNNSSPRNSNKIPKQHFFMQMLEELRTTTIKAQKQQKTIQNKQTDIKDLDIDQDSDSHDQKQDMEANRLNQFKFLVKNQIKHKDPLQKQKHNYDIRFTSEQQNKSNQNFKFSKLKNKLFNEFELLNQSQNDKKPLLRNAKTGDGKRNHSPEKMKNSLMEENHRQKTLPEELITQNKDGTLINFFNNNFQTPFSNQNYKRPIYTSTKRNKRQIESGNIQKRQKTIGNYFGEYRLLINQTEIQNQRKRQKLDLIRKLQSRRQNSRKNRAQSTNDMKSNSSLRKSIPLNINNSYLKNQKIYPQIVHGPTQFTFSLPFSQAAQGQRSYILKPKLKVHIRQKPKSVQSIQNSITVKERQSSINIKQKSQKMIQGLYNSQKQSARQKHMIPQNLLIQQGGHFTTKKNYFSQKNTGRQSNRCTKIDLNDVNNTTFLKNLKVNKI